MRLIIKTNLKYDMSLCQHTFKMAMHMMRIKFVMRQTRTSILILILLKQFQNVLSTKWRGVSYLSHHCRYRYINPVYWETIPDIIHAYNIISLATARLRDGFCPVTFQVAAGMCSFQVTPLVLLAYLEYLASSNLSQSNEYLTSSNLSQSNAYF